MEINPKVSLEYNYVLTAERDGERFA